MKKICERCEKNEQEGYAYRVCSRELKISENKS